MHFIKILPPRRPGVESIYSYRPPAQQTRAAFQWTSLLEHWQVVLKSSQPINRRAPCEKPLTDCIAQPDRPHLIQYPGRLVYLGGLKRNSTRCRSGEFFTAHSVRIDCRFRNWLPVPQNRKFIYRGMEDLNLPYSGKPLTKGHSLWSITWTSRHAFSCIHAEMMILLHTCLISF